MTDISWTNSTRKLSDLKPWARNPRYIKKEEGQHLLNSFDEFNQTELVLIGPDNELYNGHQRLSVLLKAHGPDFEIEVRVCSRKLSEKEREKLTIYLHKGTVGQFDFNVLANEFELDELIAWGFSEKELGIDTEEDVKIKVGDPEEKISPELHERQDYLVFYIDNEFDFNYLCEFFGVKRVYTAPVKGKTIAQRGIGRVIPASKLIEAITPHD